MKRRTRVSIPLQLVELENENYHLLVDSLFDNNESGKWTIDTGASKTVFDGNLSHLFNSVSDPGTEVRSAGIGEGHIETRTGVLHRVSFGALEMKSWPVAIIDLKHINALYKTYANEQIVGLLGSDFLLSHKAVIDFERMELLFSI